MGRCSALMITSAAAAGAWTGPIRSAQLNQYHQSHQWLHAGRGDDVAPLRAVVRVLHGQGRQPPGRHGDAGGPSRARAAGPRARPGTRSRRGESSAFSREARQFQPCRRVLLFAGYQGDLVLPGAGSAADQAGRSVSQQSGHRYVFGRDQRGEPADALLAGTIRQPGQQFAAQTPALPVIGDRDGDVGGVRVIGVPVNRAMPTPRPSPLSRAPSASWSWWSRSVK